MTSVPVQAPPPSGSHTLATFIDSGADANIMDEELAHQLGIGRVSLSSPLSASALDGYLLGTVTQQTTPVHVLLSGNHHGTIQFHSLRSPLIPLILGYPCYHNPHIDCIEGVILWWSAPCHQVCLNEACSAFPTSASH